MNADMERPTGSLTFLFSDVEGSTRLLMALGDGYAAAHGAHQAIIRSAVGSNRGIEISTEGDSFFVVFRSALDALSAAAEIQRAMATHRWPAGNEFRVRIGIHSGQAILVAGDYVGLDVNRAARIGNAANGGQVILSEATRVAVGTTVGHGLEVRDLGRHRLKDVGVERLWQLDVRELSGEFGPLRSLEAHPTNLPVDRTSFIGRTAEVRALARSIRSGPLVTVTGPGGIGKSRLAVAAARSLLDEYPDGVFYLDLAVHEGLAMVLPDLARVTDTSLPPGDDPIVAFVERFTHRSALLLFDTADRVRGFDRLVSRLLDVCAEIRILVTARMPLHLGAEHEFPAAALALPPTYGADPSAIARTPAVELFVRRAQAVRPDFMLTESTAQTVGAIVTRLDGLPLAIELAAARIRVFPPEALLARLDRRLPLLRGGAVDAPERQQTAHATIAWSYELLEPDERTMFGRLSVFADRFDLDDVVEVAGGPEGDVDAAGVLERLIDRSLVSVIEQDGSTDFRLLGIIREFAAESFEADPDIDKVRDRHARHVLALVDECRAQLDGPQEGPALRRLERSADDVRAVLDRQLEQREIGADPDHLALRLAAAMGRMWYLRGRSVEGSDYLERALAADAEAPIELRASALHHAGVLLDERGLSERSIERLEAALGLFRSIGDERAIARELNSVGVVVRNTGDTERAATLLHECLAMRRELADTSGVATTLTNLGVVEIDRGRYDEARTYLEEALAIDRASGGAGLVAYSSSMLGTALLRMDRRDEAIELIGDALRSFTTLGNADGAAECLERLGEAILDDDPDGAARLILAAIEIRRRDDIPLRPPDHAVTVRLLDTIDGSIDEAAVSAARADASAMDLDAATIYALAVTSVGHRRSRSDQREASAGPA